MNTTYLLLAMYESPRLTIQQLAHLMGVSIDTARNQMYRGELPVPTYKEGGRVFADIRDVAEYLDKMRKEARAAAGL